MKVGLNASAGEVDQKAGCEHLADGDGVSRQRGPGCEEGHGDGERGDDAAQENGGQEVDVRMAELTFPGQRGEPQRGENPCDPL